MKTEVKTVTPSTATEMLKRNNNNRKLSDSHVSYLSREMKEGRWMFDGQPLRFNGDGCLLDGQHRLSAIVQSGTQQEFLVVTGIAKEAFKVMDTGKNRNAADVFSLAGVEYATNVSAATKIVYIINETNNNQSRSISKTSSSELLDYYMEHQGILECVKQADGLSKEFSRVLSQSYIAGYMYLFSQRSVTDAESFFHKLCTGLDLSIESPIYILRKRLITNSVSKERLMQIEKNALLIKAWNHFRSGKEIKSLRWNSVNEKFPKIS